MFFIPCAMQREADIVLRNLENVREEEIYGFKFFFGYKNGKEVMVGISTPGLINMTAMMMVAVFRGNIESIVNYGMVGGYGTNIHKNDIIVGTDCMNTNSYITENKAMGIDINKWNYVTFTDGGKDEFKTYYANNGLLQVCRGLEYNSSNVFFGRIGSGDMWNREHEKMRMLMEKYQVLCEEMESAAIYQVANRYNIPCISIKGVSDNEMLGETYDDSVLGNLEKYVMMFLNEITK